MSKAVEQIWSVAQAKSRFSELLERSRTNGPQTITRNGRTTAVVVSAEEWDRRTKPKDTLVDFFNRSPLRGSGVDLDRLEDQPRDLDL